ncbi:FUSC family protein [Staphylococcus pragensis]|uniref:FUSC family protein n=2 Tax=Staphylococcus pragensis TaxID=1611836 RepID=A0A4Z1BF26_9STAP|nr:FUSC family protein [Staphylococcus pragensis]RTX89994.1 FUSC family protein [Staphylococcus carnosus]TGN27434.1 FUSC family protein [Staphylococcus pragensis]GGG92776.1 FUSC family protein [Staphylococcus pragensis]
MGNVLHSLITFDTTKIDPMKGLRQGLLMIIPALVGYLLGDFNIGLLVSTGTLAHVYVFKGSPQSMLRTVILCSISFAICMMLGTLTVTQPVLYGFILLLVTVIPFYIFSALKIAGPSSTFFLVTFCLPSNLPVAPDQALFRGLAILGGGALATFVVLLMILFQKQKVEDRAITSDFKMIHELMHHFNDTEKFKEVSQSAVTAFKNSDELLITATAGAKSKLNSRFQRLLLLHTSAQGIYSELLELHEQNIRPLPQDLIDMMDVTMRNAYRHSAKRENWTKEVHVNDEFDNLLQHILKIDEIANLNANQIEHQASVRKPLYSQRILHNLTLDSIVFRNTLIYAVILGAAIFVSLAFNIQKSYWIPLSAHTIMLGMTTRRMLDRSVARGLGTILGTLLLSGILFFNPHLVVAVIIMGLAAMVTEAFVGSNYAFAVIFITTQVILLNGLASHNLSISIAYTRIFDVLIGIVIAIVGILLINHQTASAMLPRTIAEVARKEAILFHYLFSENAHQDTKRERKESFELSVKMSNMTQTYNSASGELFSNKAVLRYYYPSIFALEEINFMLMRAMQNKDRQHISDTQMGEYLVTFENVAKHFELQSSLDVKELSDLPQYNYLKSALMKLQSNCVASRKDVDDTEVKSATEA